MAQLPNGQTCLENIALTHRPVLKNKNEYLDTIPYDVSHPNAIADGDARGRGVGGAHTHSTPDCTKADYIGEHFMSAYDYDSIKTDRGADCAGGAGDCVDINGRPGLAFSGRNALLGINNYSECGIQYSADYVNTLQNVADGQYVVGETVKTAIKCNAA
jgi:hypothetical protein